MARPPNAPSKVGSTPALKDLYISFLKPFLSQYYIHEEQTLMAEGVEGFFSVKSRPISWCKAKRSFTMPGYMWRSPSRPFDFIEGVGRRYVKPGSSVVIRSDANLPDKHDVEFDEQVFVLSDAELSVVKEYLEVLA